MPVSPGSYNPIIPQPADLLNQSQPQLLNNFGALQSWIDQNHVDYSAGGNQPGKHTFVQLPVQAGTPAGGFVGGEVALYNKTYTVTGNNEMFIVNQAGTQIPITPSAQTTNGWSYLPSGILMKWGKTTSIAASDPFPYAYPTGANIPVFTGVFVVLITDIDANSGGGAPFDHVVTVQQGTISTTGFSLIYHSSPPATTVVNYLAIGY